MDLHTYIHTLLTWLTLSYKLVCRSVMERKRKKTKYKKCHYKPTRSSSAVRLFHNYKISHYKPTRSSSAVRLFHDYDRQENRRKWQPVAEEWLFGQNWAMEVRTFARIKTAIWDQLLATKAEIISVLCVKRHKVNTSILLGKIACFAVSLCVVHSPRRLFFRLNHLRIVRKRCSHSTFSSQATRRSKSVNSGFVPLQQIRRNLRVVVWVLNTINSHKRIGIFSAEIFTIQVASLRAS